MQWGEPGQAANNGQNGAPAIPAFLTGLSVSLSQRPRTSATDRGTACEPLQAAPDGAGGWRLTATTPLGKIILVVGVPSATAEAPRAPEVWSSHRLLRLSIEPAPLVARGEGTLPLSRWLRVHGWPLPTGTQAALANGLNGWSESPLMTATSVLRGETNPAQRPFGDFYWYEYGEEPGRFHAWSAAYLQVTGGADPSWWGNQLVASCSDERFYTVFEFDLPAGTLSAALDLGGCAPPADGLLAEWILPAPAEVSQLAPLATLMNEWSKRVELRRRPAGKGAALLPALTSKELPLRGYTSWYYRYRDISPDWLKQNLAGIAARKSWQVFQVDDGYQAFAGDWLNFSKAFPNGLTEVFAAARGVGKMPGIWCAPFIALEDSNAFREHPEWLLKDEHGALVLCGDFPHWGGKFYALDTELDAVREHLTTVLTTMLKGWGASFLKADFLYAAAKVHSGGISRAARGERAHRFLHELCGSLGVRFLSCGAVMADSYHHCDFARLGPDVLPDWEDQASASFHSREKCSTRASLVNAVTRLPFDGAGFRGDPDVFMLRDEANQLTTAQKLVVATVNGLFGSLIFCSDLVSNYSKEARETLAHIESLRDRLGAVHTVERVGMQGGSSYLVETTAGVFALDLGGSSAAHPLNRDPHLEVALKP